MNGIIDTVRRVWDTLSSSLADPASNPVAALLGLAIISLVLLILVVLSYLALTAERKPRKSVKGKPPAVDASSGPSGGESAEATEAAPAHDSRRSLRGFVAAVVLIVIAVVAGIGYTSTDSFCSRCHHNDQAFESRAEGAHVETPCRACHEGGGVTAYLDAKYRGLSNLSVWLGGSSAFGGSATTIPNSACLGCHEDIEEGVVVARSIRVRHSDILEAGYRCVECHNTEGHGYAVERAAYPEMRYCIMCHDGTTASTACESCHPEDAGVAVRRSRRVFPKVDVVKEDCRGCHSVESCNDCHGIELPHTRKFVAGYHARAAYTDLDTCLSCHDIYNFCSDTGCHSFKRTRLVSADGLSRVGEQHPGFLTWHGGFTAERCAGCHSDDNVCDYCHGDVPEH